MTPQDRIRLRRNPKNVAVPQGNDDLYFDADGNLIHESPGGVKETVGGGSGSVTAESVAAVLPEALAQAPETSRAAMQVDQSSLCNARLAKFRERLDTVTLAPRIAFFGDSMLEAYNTNIKLRDCFHAAFGMGGYSYLDASSSGGATSISTTFTYWFKGRMVRLSGSGHTATVNVDSVVPVEANTLKLYYVSKPGGGVFKVQTRKNLGTWTDEASYLTVSTDAVVAGQIITITKTDLRAIWDIRAVWVSGGECDILGGALYDTASTGARLAMLAAGSTDISQWISAPSAVSQPIIADIAPHLCVLSHLDGSVATEAYQGTWQDSVSAWAATTPTWLVIGPPVGCTDVADANQAAQADAQRTLADSRNDAFWDNRQWTNCTPAQAVSRGFLVDNTDPHYTGLAQRNWIPLMLRDTGLAESAYRGTAGGKGEIRVLQGPALRKSRRLAAVNDDYALEIAGDLDLGHPPGRSGANIGKLVLWDTDGATNANDCGIVAYTGNAIKFSLSAQTRLILEQPIGTLQLYDSVATAAAPNGRLGIPTNPFKELNLGKTITAAATTGAQTINKSTGSVNFAAAATSLVVTNSLVTASSVIICTIGTNDATMTSVQAVASSGSFTIYANAAATGETRVNFILIP